MTEEQKMCILVLKQVRTAMEREIKKTTDEYTITMDRFYDAIKMIREMTRRLQQREKS